MNKEAERLREAARELHARVWNIAADYGQTHQPNGDWAAVWQAYDRFLDAYGRFVESDDEDAS